MKQEDICSTPLLDYEDPHFQRFITDRHWSELTEDAKINAIYSYVRNEILFGYNDSDVHSATQIWKEGFGQCNTKAILLMACLRSVQLPCRLHAAYVTKDFQKGATSWLLHLMAPKRILHTWVEVYFKNRWIALEGVIIDDGYLHAIQKKFPNVHAPFQRYAIATKCLDQVDLAWKKEDIFIQKEAVVEDLGIYSSPDEVFATYAQPLGKVKTLLYAKIGSKIMTKRVNKIRKTANLQDTGKSRR